MEALKKALSDRFGLEGDIHLRRVEAGFLSENHFVSCGGAKYFLKGYQSGNESKIAEIHKVKHFFASKGIPVILPIPGKDGKTYFTIGEKLFALFPFVSGIHYDRGTIPKTAIEALGVLLADLHKAGARADFSIAAGFKDKGRETFLAVAREISGLIKKRPVLDDFDRRALAGLEEKIALSIRQIEPAEKLLTEPYILLQGDFHEQNVFFSDERTIKAVFDFEKAMIGPRSYELWRSADYMFLNGDFSEKRISNAIAYLTAYNRENPISPEELGAGLDVYYQRLIHSLWVEQEHYLKNNTRVDRFLDRTTIPFLAANKEAFKKRMIEAVYGGGQ
ncbi:MAG TPA: phosphotransferase [Candidatus Paceibacterota bacterium]|nr:phosphotransferase [Candidatus Paceibacterota bacterium]